MTDYARVNRYVLNWSNQASRILIRFTPIHVHIAGVWSQIFKLAITIELIKT